MANIFPEAESFGTQFAKNFSAGLGQGIGNSPNMFMDLMKQKRQNQAQYAESGTQLFRDYNKDATPEEEAAFAEKAQALAKPNESPAEAKARLTQLAIDETNKKSRIKELARTENAREDFKGFFTGNNKEVRGKKREALQKKIAPLLKEKNGKVIGREWLSSQGLEPEEVEGLISPLSESATKTISDFPSFKKEEKNKGWAQSESKLSEDQKQFFRMNLARTLKEDPNANLLLLRKQYEDKGVNWREFRDAIHDLEDSGELNISQNPEHAPLMNKLYEPPVAGLKHFLHGVKLLAR